LWKLAYRVQTSSFLETPLTAQTDGNRWQQKLHYKKSVKAIPNEFPHEH
jgi:hypothetical protein